MRDHPDIERTERTGYPDEPKKWPHCPICGEECDTVYLFQGSDIVGCENCMTTESAWKCEECFGEEQE